MYQKFLNSQTNWERKIERERLTINSRIQIRVFRDSALKVISSHCEWRITVGLVLPHGIKKYLEPSNTSYIGRVWIVNLFTTNCFNFLCHIGNEFWYTCITRLCGRRSGVGGRRKLVTIVTDTDFKFNLILLLHNHIALYKRGKQMILVPTEVLLQSSMLFSW